MTSKPKRQAPSDRTVEWFQPPPRMPLAYPDGKFSVLPPRGDMQNPIYLHLPGHMAALSRHLGSPDTTIVLGEVPVGWNVSRRRGLRALVGVAEYLTALVGRGAGIAVARHRCRPPSPSWSG